MVSSPSLQIDTANLNADVANQAALWQSPSLSAILSPSDERPSMDLGRASSKANKRARIESMKLLAHVLVQLQTRHMPPTVYDSFTDKSMVSSPSIGAVVDTMKDAIKRKGASVVGSPSQNVDDDSDDDDTRLVYSTDDTYELMMQLRNILLLSVAQGWRIFDDELDAESSKTSHLFRRTRSSFQSNRSGSPSPLPGSHIHASELLMQCVSVLASVVQEDCRYKTAAPRPLRPPNALHALCLDIAQFLINSHKRNPQVVSHIVHAMIPAFSTFPEEMHVKLLKFFEECVIWGLLQDLCTFQSGGGQDSPKEPDKMDEEKASVTIQIDEVDDFSDHDPDHKYNWDSSASFGPATLSTNAPSQARSIYHLSSIVPPLLSAILENVDVSKEHLELHDRFRRIIFAITQLKSDACNDLLHIIAYHTPQARPSACAVLMALWHTAVGHIIVSEPLQIGHPLSDNTRTPTHPYSHQFIPWRFSPTYHLSTVPNSCHSCASPIVGFGLMCPLCMCNVHFDCYDYPQGCSLVQYTEALDCKIQKVAMYRFCRNGQVLPRVSQMQYHDFHCLNLFTLCLCFECRKPLWGYTSQGIGCTACSIFFHFDCFSAISTLPPCGHCIIDSGHIVVTKAALCGTFNDYYRRSKNDFDHCSYEEISIYLGFFWTQLQILANGIALGSIVIAQNGRNVTHISQLDEFELHLIVQRCQALLESDNLRSSQLMDDYQFENHLSRHEHNWMFDWSCLIFVSTVIRGPHFSTRTTQYESPGFLNATNLGLNEYVSFEDAMYSMVPIGRARQALGNELNIVSEPAVRHFLEYLPQLGFFQMVENPDGNSQSLSSFTLPFGFDSSVEVEILVSAIEACLSDESLSINEVGFLLLSRRLSPNGMSSEYALRRLARCLVTWILAEDVAVASILRDFVARQRTLPGVPQSREMLAWPERLGPRPAASSTTNGGDYVAFRRALHSRYSTVWLLSLHDQDPVLYAEIIYDACADFAIEDSMEETMDILILSPDKSESYRLQKILRCIIKLLQASVVFSAYDRLISRWMESAASSKSKESMAPLHRVFELERNNMFRLSTSSDSAVADLETPGPSVDPWRPILTLANQRGEQLARSLDWLNLLASGGVQIPTSHFLRFVALISEEKVLKNGISLINVVFKNTWINPIRQDLLLVIAKLHANFSPAIVAATRSRRDIETVLQLIRQSLASCLLLFGCDRKKLIELDMVTEGETRGLPHRRKINIHHSSSRDPITIDASMTNAIEQYVDMAVDEISCIVAKFFNAFLTESPLMEAYEVDNFVLRNGRLLAKGSWQFYNIQKPELYEIRAGLLSRAIVVDSQPFHDIFLECLLPTVSWEERLSTVTRLFRILQDVINPSFEVEGRHWRSSMAVVLYFYFSTLWTDGKEEIRLAVKTLALSLLPAHLQAMESCWVELLTTAPILERVRLVSFLLQVLSYFPRWKVLSWPAITDVLAECSCDRNSSPKGDDPDMVSLRVALLLVSLHMIANGVPANVSTLLKLKKHLVELIGFENVAEILQLDGQTARVEFQDISTIFEEATPCIGKLTAVFDSPVPFELTRSMMTYAYSQDDKPSKLLVGSIFVDVILEMFCSLKDLLSFPALTLRGILESLCIVVYKHDFESPPFVHLQHHLRQAVLRSLELIAEDIGYECRQVTLSFIQGFIKQCGRFMGNVIYKTIEQLAKFIAAEGRHPSDALIIQARTFLEDTFTTYTSKGLFVNMFKRPMSREFFVVLREIFDYSGEDNQNPDGDVKKTLLHEVMAKMVDFDRDSFQAALHNLLMYLEIVRPERYSVDTVGSVGQQLVHFARRASGEDHIDASPLFLIPAILSENIQGRVREIITYVEKEIRIILPRASVTFTPLYRLLSATQSLQRRNDSVIFTNGIAHVIFDILEDGLGLKTRVQPTSLTTLLQLVVHDDSPEWLPLAVSYPNLFLGLVDTTLNFLQGYEWPETKLDDAFMASLSAATVIWRAIDDDGRLIEKLAELGSEKIVSTDYRIRAWNVIALAALKYSDGKCATALFPFLNTFSNIQFNALRTYVHSESTSWDLATANINHAYIAIKLWMLLARKAATVSAEGEFATFTRVWNELWPPFETLAFNAEKQLDLHPTLALLISSSVADLFIFLHSLQTPLALQTALQIATLERLKTLAGVDAASRKVSRAIYSLSQPPISLPLELLVNQASKEIVAAEKLRVLESRKDIGRAPEKRPAERHWRDIRIPT